MTQLSLFGKQKQLNLTTSLALRFLVEPPAYRQWIARYTICDLPKIHVMMLLLWKIKCYASKLFNIHRRGRGGALPTPATSSIRSQELLRLLRGKRNAIYQQPANFIHCIVLESLHLEINIVVV